MTRFTQTIWSQQLCKEYHRFNGMVLVTACHITTTSPLLLLPFPCLLSSPLTPLSFLALGLSNPIHITTTPYHYHHLAAPSPLQMPSLPPAPLDVIAPLTLLPCISADDA